ncbi:low molecular weight protein arginine phosphatase [Bacillus thermotolerans]|uniref:low molecular weight protein arginine phosphatase n=1 Tax=Bacillus thermotolerans TaxID=1221996 RepID=UPI0005894D99|nr:low molecular weight protein arginine phosphatase [Bacillus thermotolerans]
MNILFVCTGNTCRSPMAEAILKSKKEGWGVQSAGVYAADGSPASEQAVQVLKEHDLIHEHISQGITPSLIDWSDKIFTMTSSHKQALLSRFPSALEKLWTIKEFVNGSEEDVMDPYGGSVDDYRYTYQELEELIDRLVEKLSGEAGE